MCLEYGGLEEFADGEGMGWGYRPKVTDVNLERQIMHLAGKDRESNMR